MAYVNITYANVQLLIVVLNIHFSGHKLCRHLEIKLWHHLDIKLCQHLDIPYIQEQEMHYRANNEVPNVKNIV
jgi:hypothetical protein